MPWQRHPWGRTGLPSFPLRAVPALCIRRRPELEHGITKRTEERGWEAQSPASDLRHPTWWVTSWKTLGSPWWSPTSVSPRCRPLSKDAKLPGGCELSAVKPARPCLMPGK